MQNVYSNVNLESWNPELMNRMNQLQSCLAQLPEGAIDKQ